jgi:hypothetical protein
MGEWAVVVYRAGVAVGRCGGCPRSGRDSEIDVAVGIELVAWILSHDTRSVCMRAFSGRLPKWGSVNEASKIRW